MNFMTTDLPAFVVLSDTDLKAYPEYALATRLDWRKIPRFLEGAWPSPWPKVLFLGDDPKADAWWLRQAKRAECVVFDVETEQLPTGEFTGRIIQVGLYPKGGQPAVWDRVIFPDYDFTNTFRCLLDKPLIAHNTPFDVARIAENFGVTVWEYRDLHDTILMHHLLWAEFPHGLEFLTSVYSQHPKAKHLGVGNLDYLVGDIVGTMEAFEALSDELDKHPGSKRLYYQELKPLLPILVEFMATGVPVDRDFVTQSLDWIPQQMAAAKAIGDTYCGYPVSLESGAQLRVLLDDIEDVFEAAKKELGHSVKRQLTPKGELSFDKDTVNELRSAFLPVDFNEELDADLAMERIAQGAHPLLEAKALWIRARILLSNYIKPLLVPLEQGEHGWEHTLSLHVGEGAPRRYCGNN